MSEIPEGLEIYNVKHLPIVSAYANKLGIVEEINRQVESEMEVSPGDGVLMMVLDTLSGRSPLYHLEHFARQEDVELLLGTDYPPDAFNDDAMGRLLDKIYQAGSFKLFTSCALRACWAFDLSESYFHFDTTNKNVMGDYNVENTEDIPFQITYGHSKDKRPDLKQLVITMLCVDKNIPLLGSVESGNASDKKLNNELLNKLSSHLYQRREQLKTAIYVADSALVTPENLEDLADMLFVTRLPATYSECSRVIEDAVEKDNWEEVGQLAQAKATKKRPVASYRVYESTVTLYDKEYRAIVVHSSSHDKRRQKRLSKEKEKSLKSAQSSIKKEIAIDYACQADAEQAAQRLGKKKWDCHQLEIKIEERPKYEKGRPAKEKARLPKEVKYGLKVEIKEREKELKKKEDQAGCFVLLAKVPKEGELGHNASEILQVYKEQYGVEQNFGFLKEPVLVNSLFLKNPERIEALCFVLLLSLLLWRLMEKTMRSYVEQENTPLVGLDKKTTRKPTSYMMTTKFSAIMVARWGQERRLLKPLSAIQKSYLKALGVEPEIFVSSSAMASQRTG